MKHLITSTLLLLAILLPTTTVAQSIEVDGIYYNFYDNEASVTYPSYGAYSGNMVIPATVTYNGTTYSVTSIGYYAFNGSNGLTSILIPNSVTSIGDNAFYECSGLTSIEIPNSVTYIGSYAFFKCTGLTSIRIPSSVTSINEATFSYCPSLTSITVASGNSTYDSRNNCNAIIETASNTLITGCKNTIIPNSITTIGQRAFQSCLDMTNINIPNSVITISNFAFLGCTGLTSINLPNSVSSIRNYAFSNCSALTAITVANDNPFFDSRNNCNAIIETNSNRLVVGCKNTIIPNDITSIGFSAFEGCTRLTTISIPNSVTNIEWYAFCWCSGLKTIDIPNSVTNIGKSAFQGCDGLKSINIPNSVISIGEMAFEGCTKLTSLTIPNSVQTLGAAAFRNCYSLKKLYWNAENCQYSSTTYSAPFNWNSSLTHIIIGSNVQSIGDNMFYLDNYYNNIKTVTCQALVPPVITDVCFSPKTYENATLCVSKDSKSAYLMAEGWKAFNKCMSPGGDLDGDGKISISDVTSLINYLLNGDVTGINIDAADSNDDGRISIDDITSLINYLLTECW